MFQLTCWKATRQMYRLRLIPSSPSVINSMTCPFTVLLNVSVIMAVKRRPSLQSNANILLACLEATDALTGLIVQSSFILQQISHLLGTANHETFHLFHKSSLRTVSVCSYLHLTLVTCGRLVAIKFTMHYPKIVNKKSVMVVVISCKISAFSLEILGVMQQTRSKIPFLFLALFLFSCFVFIASCLYVVLYLETLRHKKLSKARQVSQEDVWRFLKQDEAPKTTVFVVGAVVLCFFPAIFLLLRRVSGMLIAAGSGCFVDTLLPWSIPSLIY